MIKAQYKKGTGTYVDIEGTKHEVGTELGLICLDIYKNKILSRNEILVFLDKLLTEENIEKFLGGRINGIRRSNKNFKKFYRNR